MVSSTRSKSFNKEEQPNEEDSFMLRFLPRPLLGIVSFVYFVVNVLVHTAVLFLVAFLKLLLPLACWRRFCSRVLTAIASNWIAVNNLGLRLTRSFVWEIEGLEGLDPNGWYLVLCNHQSWVDIVVLQKVFLRKIPFLKFFLKQELIWVPVLGLAWWALDFPFMKRYSKEFIKKHPHLKGKDLEITRRACRKFQNIPVSVMNFVEGTRFKPHKHRKQSSPFNNLLKPKAAGIAFVLGAMGQQIRTILDVTIVYPKGVQDFFSFLASRHNHVQVHVRKIEVTDDLIGDYFEDQEFKEHFQAWLNQTWAEKDHLMDSIIKKNQQSIGG